MDPALCYVARRSSTHLDHDVCCLDAVSKAYVSRGRPAGSPCPFTGRRRARRVGSSGPRQVSWRPYL